MPVPWVFIPWGGNEHLSFAFALQWWPGRKLRERTPSTWKISCASLVSANGEILHLEPGNRSGSTSFLPSSNTCCQYFCCGSSAWTGMLWVKVLMRLQWPKCLFFYGSSSALWVDKFHRRRWELKHSYQTLFERRETRSVLCNEVYRLHHCKNSFICKCKPSLHILHSSSCTLKYCGVYWMGITHCPSRFGIPESRMNPGIKGTEFRALTGLGIYLIELNSS